MFNNWYVKSAVLFAAAASLWGYAVFELIPGIKPVTVPNDPIIAGFLSAVYSILVLVFLQAPVFLILFIVIGAWKARGDNLTFHQAAFITLILTFIAWLVPEVGILNGLDQLPNVVAVFINIGLPLYLAIPNPRQILHRETKSSYP